MLRISATDNLTREKIVVDVVLAGAAECQDARIEMWRVG